MLAYMEIIYYLCSVIKKEIVKQLKIKDYEDNEDYKGPGYHKYQEHLD